MKETISVLLVDDHAIVRQGIKMFLELQDDLTVVGEVESGQQAIEFVRHNPPDVVLMDLIMPEMDGVTATHHIRQISPQTQIIILTSYHEDEHIFPAIRAGALSYLLKDVKAPVLVEAIRKASNNEAMLHPNIATRIIHEMNGAQKVNPFQELTEREMEVLRLVAQGHSNNDVAEKLVVTPKTVRTYVSNILSKLHLNDRTQAAVYAWQEGIVRRDET